MKRQVRIQLKHGSARVDEYCSQATIDMLNKITEIAYNKDSNHEICPYCKRTEPCAGSYPEGCFHPKCK